MKKLMMIALMFAAAGKALALTDVEKGIQNNFATQIGYICGQDIALQPFSGNPYGSNNACNGAASQIAQAYKAVGKGQSNDAGAYAQMYGVLTTLGTQFNNPGWAQNFKNFVWNNYQIHV